MSNEFKREERYIVVKIKDAQAIDSDEMLNGFRVLRDFLKQWHIPTREALVIEKDWPEFEPAWAMIERRMTGAVHWDGKGLPPVGVECDIKRIPHGHWGAAIVRFSSENVIVWDWIDDPAINGKCTSYAHEVELRPVRTPEQIAAEEREKAIEEMATTAHIPGQPFMTKREVVARLYDAGYRKQVAP